MIYCITYQCELPIRELTLKNSQEKAHEILDRSCLFFDLPKHIIISPTRKREIVSCRQMAMSALSKNTRLSLREIGLMFNKRDHATVIHSKNTVQDLCDSDPIYRETYNKFLTYISKP